MENSKLTSRLSRPERSLCLTLAMIEFLWCERRLQQILTVKKNHGIYFFFTFVKRIQQQNHGLSQ